MYLKGGEEFLDWKLIYVEMVIFCFRLGMRNLRPQESSAFLV